MPTTPDATLKTNQTALLTNLATKKAAINNLFSLAIATPSTLGNKWVNARAQAVTLQTQANNHLTLCIGNIEADKPWKAAIMSDAQARANADMNQLISDGDYLASVIPMTFVFDAGQYPKQDQESDADYLARLSSASVNDNASFNAWKAKAMSDGLSKVLADCDSIVNDVVTFIGWIMARTQAQIVADRSAGGL